MTTNKPGSVNQQPLYGCTSCYEDWTWPAGDLRVFGSECWCDLCWDERRWGFPDLPYWDELEPYTPALQAECALLREQRDAMAEHKMAAHQLVGICEPIEGFAARPQDIMPAVRDMALRIEALEAENERLRKDAERYRWLREHGRYSGKVLVDHADMGRVLRIEKQLDEIIDAEMQRPNA